MDKKKLRNDIILVVSLLLVAIISLIVVLSTRSKGESIAKVYVRDELTYTINLAKNEEKNYPVYAFNSNEEIMNIKTTKDGKIGVEHSNCPHQDCVNMGYINESNHPIICAYNHVYIVIEGTVEYDVVI